MRYPMFVCLVSYYRFFLPESFGQEIGWDRNNDGVFMKRHILDSGLIF